MKNALKTTYKVLLIAICFILSLNVSAQKNSFVQEGKRWIYEKYDIYNTHETEMVTYSIKGDTLINEVGFKKVYLNDEYHGAIRQDKGKVFFCVEGKTEDFLIYDFDAEKGDIRLLEEDLDFIVVSVDTIDVNGTKYKRLGLNYYVGDKEYDERYPEIQIVEGIGTSGNPFFITEFIVMTTTWKKLREVYINDELIFKGTDFYKPSIAGISPATLDKTTNNHRQGIYDLQGRRLAERPERGIFIENGRKIAK